MTATTRCCDGTGWWPVSDFTGETWQPCPFCNDDMHKPHPTDPMPPGVADRLVRTVRAEVLNRIADEHNDREVYAREVKYSRRASQIVWGAVGLALLAIVVLAVWQGRL